MEILKPMNKLHFLLTFITRRPKFKYLVSSFVPIKLKCNKLSVSVIGYILWEKRKKKQKQRLHIILTR